MIDELLKSLNIEKEYQELINNKTIIVNKVLDKMTNWDEFYKYYSILKEILPIGYWHDEMPQTFINYLEDKDYLNKGEVLYYNTICSWMESDNEVDENLLNEVKDYIKENMICGTSFDW